MKLILILLLISQFISIDTLSAKWVNFSELKIGDFVLHEDFGEIRINSINIKDKTIEVYYRDSHQPVVLYVLNKKQFAYSRSEEADEIKTKRALNYISIKRAVFLASLFALERMISFKESLDFYSQITGLQGVAELNKHHIKSDISDLWRSWSEFSAKGIELTHVESQRIEDFMFRIKREYGIDLAQWGVIYAILRNDPEKWFITRLVRNSNLKRKNDIFKYHLNNIWQNGIDLLVSEEGLASRPSDFYLSLKSYIPINQFEKDDFSDFLLQFKKNPTFNQANEILEANRNEIKLFLDKSHSTNFTFLPILPSSNKKESAPYVLASALAQMFNGDLLDQAYVKTRVIKRQTETERGFLGRIENVAGAYKVHKEMVVGKNIIIVDDILTTGATTEELKRMLYFSGAKSVRVFSLGQTRVALNPEENSCNQRLISGED